MRACVFVGPTLRPQDLPADDDIVALPPVAQGDVYRIAQRRPQAIGIIDGYFEGVLAVWHKEILWAMAEGIHVFGSASMGALRAAELHAFGMVGVGRIFEAYRDGELEDDDEVAVIHGPPETGYLALSEALVNIRRTLSEAALAAVISPSSRDALVRLAKELFYHDRTFERLLEAVDESFPAGEIDALRAWLPQGRVDQKREDALAMLAAMRALLASGPEPMRVDYTLEWTEVWDDATAAAAASPVIGPGGSPAWVADERVLEELRLEPDTYAAVRDRALLRFLARREAERRRHTADTGARRDAARSPARPPRPVYPRRPRPLARDERHRGQAAGTAARGRSAARGDQRAGDARLAPCAARRAAPAGRVRAARGARPRQAGRTRGARDGPSDRRLRPCGAARAARLVLRAAPGPAAAGRH